MLGEVGGSAWLRPEDAQFAAADAEDNEAQALRNAQMRDMLQRRRLERDAGPESAAPEEFMSLSTAGGGGSSSSCRPEVPEKGEAPCRPPWFVERPHLENTVLRLHEELLDFVKFMSHTAAEERARKRWVKTIANTCRALWSDCQVKVFGSYSTGLSLPNGDVDIAVLDVPDAAPKAMKMLANRLLADGEISWLEIIESAKVPVVKVRAQASGIRADIVFNQPDGIETSRFVRERCEEFPQMRPMLVFLKYFLMQRGLHETYTGGMGSYLLCNVVLHFLQRHPSKRNAKHYRATSLGHYLYDFLKYFGKEFAYETKGISVLDGGCTFDKAKSVFVNANRRGDHSARLCLESPLGHALDLGAPCFRIAVIKNLFIHGLQCLSHLLVTRPGPEASLLCPLLLDPAHPVIASRLQLVAAQPVALPGLARSSSDLGGDRDAEGGATKRRRKSGGGDVGSGR